MCVRGRSVSFLGPLTFEQREGNGERGGEKPAYIGRRSVVRLPDARWCQVLAVESTVLHTRLLDHIVGLA